MAIPKFSLYELDQALAKEKPYLLLIEKGVQEQRIQGNGIVSFDLRIFNGRVKDVITKHVKRDVLE